MFYTSPPLPAAVTDIASAVAALNIIVDQGEGSSVSPEGIDPLDLSQTPAHFYRFAEIVMGKSIVITGNSYDFSGSSVTFDATSAGVYNMYADPTLAVMKTLLSESDFQTCQSFSAAYTRLLDGLNAAFNGNPEGINDVINNNMFPLAATAGNVLAIPAGKSGRTAGLCFELFRPARAAGV